jgi:hypothetical protein
MTPRQEVAPFVAKALRDLAHERGCNPEAFSAITVAILETLALSIYDLRRQTHIAESANKHAHEDTTRRDLKRPRAKNPKIWP